MKLKLACLLVLSILFASKSIAKDYYTPEFKVESQKVYSIMAKGNTLEAFNYWESFSDKWSDSDGRHEYVFANLLVSNKQFEEADDYFLQAITLDSQFPVPYLGLAESKSFQGDFESAHHISNQMLDAFPNWFRPYQTASTIYYQEGDYEKAIELSKMSLEKLETGVSYLLISKSNFQLNKKELAMDYYNKAIDLMPYLQGDEEIRKLMRLNGEH
jgi:tetratricopeptide (TPR) repeat protein